MQKSNSKNQNDKEKFKQEFIARLVAFSVSTLKFSRKINSKRELWPLSDQLARSAGSIGANVVEAQAGSSKRDYTNFFQIALKSANETKYWLIVARNYDHALAKEADVLLKEAVEIANVIGSSVLTLKSKK